MKVHVTLKFPFATKDVEDVIRIAGFPSINEKRAQSFGIISGETTDPEAVMKLRCLSIVQDVEVEPA